MTGVQTCALPIFVHHNDADDIGSVGDQTPGDFIGPVAQLLGRLQNAFAGLVGQLAGIAEYTGDRGLRYVGQSGHIGRSGRAIAGTLRRFLAASHVSPLRLVHSYAFLMALSYQALSRLSISILL